MMQTNIFHDYKDHFVKKKKIQIHYSDKIQHLEGTKSLMIHVIIQGNQESDDCETPPHAN